MNLMESFKTALRSIATNKMRSILTMLGIIIGIGSVIMITSIGAGSQDKLTGQFEDIGANMLSISVVDADSNSDYLTVGDVETVKKHPEVTSASAYNTMFGEVRLRLPNEKSDAYIQAVNNELLTINNFKLIHGRNFVSIEEEAQSYVAVIDNLLARKVFGREDCSGEKITVDLYGGTYEFTVIGVIDHPLGSMASMLGEDMLFSYVFIPLNTVQSMFGHDYVDGMAVSTLDRNNNDIVAAEITDMLERSHMNEDKYKVESALADIESLNEVMALFTTFISFVAGISLLVGGVGVMNIMLVTVTERTREIGIRKSLGAKKKDIRVQFLIEALIITFLGGFLGTILGYLGAKGVGSLISVTPSMSVGIIVLTTIISATIGIVFGVYPANKAAKLDPIEALRYE